MEITEDLYAEEQSVFDNAIAYAAELENGTVCEPKKFLKLAKEYGRLLRQIRRATKVHDKTTGALNTKKVELQGKVNVDALTGIYNRRFFEESLSKLKESLSINGGRLSLLMLDVDNFKKFNDTYGHVEGDECLKIVATSIKECIMRQDDFVARYGGEEFAVVLANTDKAGARKIAEDILVNLRSKNVPHEKNNAAPCVTISIGGTTVFPKEGDDESDYIKVADDALYKSKQNGRNQYTYNDYSEVTSND
ncbi:MAG: GGDEF domain-containing protein [Oscillospiraceae bacterium]|nr:GGDEF domain-containing protein [Oscillospiraceae bacterium]